MPSLLARLIELKEHIEQLPQITITFGSGHECVPASVVRYKVLAILQSYIDAARGLKPLL